MERVGVLRLLQGQTAADHLKKVPIMRGWGGDRQAEDWMTVGSGRKLEAVETEEEKITIKGKNVEEEWKEWADLLSEEFMQYARRTKFIRFVCPRCLSHI
jgi:hypothetical protein